MSNIIDGYYKHKGRELSTKAPKVVNVIEIDLRKTRGDIERDLATHLELYPGTASNKEFLLKRI
jgi:hypothetical protein